MTSLQLPRSITVWLFEYHKWYVYHSFGTSALKRIKTKVSTAESRMCPLTVRFLGCKYLRYIRNITGHRVIILETNILYFYKLNKFLSLFYKYIFYILHVYSHKFLFLFIEILHEIL